ncbi:MAG: hypothetical protein ACWGOD_03475, partial [Desulfobulbales bacterium]
HEDLGDLDELTENDFNTLSSGIAKVLLYYEALGHLSYNYALYSVRNTHNTGGFRALIKIITRQNLYPNYRNDDYFLQKLLQSELIITPPEELATNLKPSFQA